MFVGIANGNRLLVTGVPVQSTLLSTRRVGAMGKEALI
jgi:hypothetical protein